MDDPSPDSIRANYVQDGHGDGRLVAPSAARNLQPIVDGLTSVLGGLEGLMLEIGSGTGQHTIGLAGAFPSLHWQPSDPYGAHLDSIGAWVRHTGAGNIRLPIWLDAAEPWPDLGDLTGVFCANVIHISPWAVAQGVVAGAAAAGADVLVFYGPFRQGGVHTGPGNVRFDAALRAEDPAWGVRDIDDVATLATGAGFGDPVVTPMPSDNRLVVFRRG